MVGVSLNRRVGVDLEKVCAIPDLHQLTDIALSEREAKAILNIPEPQRSTAFFKVWTRKEAYLKATGEGLAALKRIEVNVGSDVALSFKSKEGDLIQDTAWTIKDLELGPEYVGAIAIEGHGVKVRSIETGAKRREKVFL